MVDSVSYLPTELTGAALQMGQYYKLHHIKPSSAYSPDVLCSQKYSFPTVSKRELVLVCSLCSFCLHLLFMGYTPQPQTAQSPLQKPPIKPRARHWAVQCWGMWGSWQKGSSKFRTGSATFADYAYCEEGLLLSSSRYGILLTQGQTEGVKQSSLHSVFRGENVGSCECEALGRKTTALNKSTEGNSVKAILLAGQQ